MESKNLLITSDGRNDLRIRKYLRKSEEKLRKLQKDLSRCQKGSKNREKCRIKVARQHEKIANQRKDFLHKLSKQTYLVKTKQYVLEDLKSKEHDEQS
ncbi:MAG: transposase [Blautia caecimuris]